MRARERFTPITTDGRGSQGRILISACGFGRARVGAGSGGGMAIACFGGGDAGAGLRSPQS